MGNITTMQIILMFAGVGLSLIIFIDGKKDTDKSWFKRNWLKMVASIIVSYVAVILGPDTFKMLGIHVPEGSNLPTVHAFLSGFLSDVIVFGLRRLKEKLRGAEGDKPQSESPQKDATNV